MTTETFMLSPQYPDCTVVSYIHAPSAELNIPVRRAIIVCPGGGYQFLSDREAEAGRAAILRRRTERVYSQLLHSG